MMKNMKRWLAAALAVMLCLSLAACKGKDFDVQRQTPIAEMREF